MYFDKSEVVCWRCKKKGHYANECPEHPKNAEGNFNMHDDSDSEDEYDDTLDEGDYEHMFTNIGDFDSITIDVSNTDHIFNNNNNNNGRLPASWILLDNQSTVNVFCTKRLNLHTNTSSAIIDEIGELPGFGTVWVHRTGIANILSLTKVGETPGFDIVYSTRGDNRNFRVEAPYGATIPKRRALFNFVPNGRGLYYLNCEHRFGPGKNGCVFGKNIINTEDQLTWKAKGKSFVIETVDGNKTKFSRHDVDRAKKTR